MDFDGRGKKWTRETSIFKFDDECKNIDIDSLCKIDVVKRIGSISTMAEVYLVTFNETKMACKILPIDSDESIDRNSKEIDFATQASKCKSIFFPKVYGALFCMDTHFYDGKCEFNCKVKIPEFYNKSKRYQQYAYLLDISPNNLKQDIMKYKKSFIEASITKEKLLPNAELPDTVVSYLLFSQVAEYDLDYYLTVKTLSNETLQGLLFDIFKAIRDMHTKLNLVHADLHLGNILIINGRPLIHDFGKSYKSTFDDINDRQKDIFYFLGQLYDKIDIPSQVKSLLDDVSDIVIDSNSRYPISEVVKFWALNI